MADNPSSAADVAEIVKEGNVRFVRLWFTDVLGQLKSFSINAAELEDAFDGGMGFDGSSITGFNPIEESDMIAMPDPSTFRLIPWRPEEENAVARMFCDIRVPGGDPYEGDPRWILRRALKRAGEMGFDAYNIGPELEYFYFRSARPEGGRPEILDEGGYFDLTTLDAGSDVRRETVLALEKMGIHVEYTHHEVGPSQHEVDMHYKNALEMADDCMTYRIVVKEYAMKYGWHATFMPKPLFGENGSGMHVHQSLGRDGSNAFFDADDQYFLSATAKAFIAGQLRHAREISSLFAQWTNSYKRLVPGYEAPVYLAWSRRNRSALIRVPLYHPGKEGATRARTDPAPTGGPHPPVPPPPVSSATGRIEPWTTRADGGAWCCRSSACPVPRPAWDRRTTLTGPGWHWPSRWTRPWPRWPVRWWRPCRS
jgi:glutamine synthetase